MWAHSEKILRVTPTTLEYTIDSFGGQSGGPVWLLGNDGWRVCSASTTASFLRPRPRQLATRITCDVIDQIRAWCSAAGVRGPMVDSAYGPACTRARGSRTRVRDLGPPLPQRDTPLYSHPAKRVLHPHRDRRPPRRRSPASVPADVGDAEALLADGLDDLLLPATGPRAGRRAEMPAARPASQPDVRQERVELVARVSICSAAHRGFMGSFLCSGAYAPPAEARLRTIRGLGGGVPRTSDLGWLAAGRASTLPRWDRPRFPAGDRTAVSEAARVIG